MKEYNGFAEQTKLFRMLSGKLGENSIDFDIKLHRLFESINEKLRELTGNNSLSMQEYFKVDERTGTVDGKLTLELYKAMAEQSAKLYEEYKQGKQPLSKLDILNNEEIQRKQIDSFVAVMKFMYYLGYITGSKIVLKEVKKSVDGVLSNGAVKDLQNFMAALKDIFGGEKHGKQD